MLAWRTLKWWQRALAVAAAAYFIAMYAWAGGPGVNLPSRWIGYVGVIAIIVGTLLNPGAFGAPLPARGWRGHPFICKVLTAGGVAAILIGFMLQPLGI